MVKTLSTDVAPPVAATAPTSVVNHSAGTVCTEATPAERTSAKNDATSERTLQWVTADSPVELFGCRVGAAHDRDGPHRARSVPAWSGGAGRRIWWRCGW